MVHLGWLSDFLDLDYLPPCFFTVREKLLPCGFYHFVVDFCYSLLDLILPDTEYFIYRYLDSIFLKISLLYIPRNLIILEYSWSQFRKFPFVELTSTGIILNPNPNPLHFGVAQESKIQLLKIELFILPWIFSESPPLFPVLVIIYSITLVGKWQWS